MNPFKASEPTSPAFYSSDNPQLNHSSPSLPPSCSVLRSAILSSTNLLQEFSQFQQKMTQLSTRKYQQLHLAHRPSLISKNSAFRQGSLPCIQPVDGSSEGSSQIPYHRRTVAVGLRERGEEGNHHHGLY